MSCKEQSIDFVISWHDGSDPAWLAEKQRYMGECDGADEVDVSASRYRDWDNLHYWFRCVETYAPWVRKIHLLTCGQVPQWLNTEHPKLNIVNHSDYIPQEYLPTFSSHPIEWNMHRIKDLAEQFVYFCDDFFLTAPVRPEDFFVRGLPCDSLSEVPISFCGRVWDHIQMNDIAFVNRHFSRQKLRKECLHKWFPIGSPRACARNLMFAFLKRDVFFGLHIHHLPQSYLKSSFEKVWEMEPELLHETSARRFRDARDVSHCVVKYYQLLTWRFHPYNILRCGRVFSGKWNPEAVAAAIRSRRYKMICINDNEDVDFECAKPIVNRAFAGAFPGKSSFEL